MTVRLALTVSLALTLPLTLTVIVTVIGAADALGLWSGPVEGLAAAVR
ncbi:hypothetical protein [Streptomyces sp. RB17]|nr:hypothetical protein [Streptomyces sp. RB17]